MKQKLTLRKQIANRVRKFRIEMKLSQSMMADKIGRDKQFIQRLESGKYQPQLDNLNELAKTFNKPICYFIDPGEN